VRINIPNSAFLGNIEPFIRSFDPGKPDELAVTFNQKWSSVHPIVLSMTAALGMSVRSRNGKISCHDTTAKSMPYLCRMKLFDYLDFNPGIELDEHESSGRFIPLTNIRNSDDLSRFIEELVPLLHTSKNQADSIKYTISELVRNVLEHAESQVGALVCAQFFKKTNRISIGVADAGIGIRQSIAFSHVVKDDGEAIKLALIPGVTGKTATPGGTEENAGAGLFFIKSIAKVNRNFFVIYSGKSTYKLLKTQGEARTTLYPDPTRDKHSLREDLPSWQGTAVGVDISTSEDQSFEQLLSKIRQAYSIDIKARRNLKKARFI